MVCSLTLDVKDVRLLTKELVYLFYILFTFMAWIFFVEPSLEMEFVLEAVFVWLLLPLVYLDDFGLTAWPGCCVCSVLCTFTFSGFFCCRLDMLFCFLGTTLII